MKTLRKLFFETKMTWWRVILFAVATAMLTAGLLILPFTHDTTFANIGVTFEWWIVFALLIICNCEKPLEAGAKTFVFFLISQPLIYLLQVPFSAQGWELFGYYKYWFLLTLLTFPGAILAWFVKKDTIGSALILAVASGGTAGIGVYLLFTQRMPWGLLSLLVCLALAVLLPLIILQKPKTRLITLLLTLAAALLVTLLMLFPKNGGQLSYYPLEEGDWEITDISGDNIGEWQIDNSREGGSDLILQPETPGSAVIVLHNLRDGTSYSLRVSFDETTGVDYETVE